MWPERGSGGNLVLRKIVGAIPGWGEPQHMECLQIITLISAQKRIEMKEYLVNKLFRRSLFIDAAV